MNPILDITAWRLIYIRYNSITDAQLNDLWIDAIVFGKPIISRLLLEYQQHYYYVMLAHLAELEIRKAAGILSATVQGTVNVTLEVDKSNLYLWFNQTRYGQKIAQLYKSFGGFRAVC